MQISTRLQVHSVQQSLANRGLEAKGRVQKFIDTEVLRCNEPYVPMDTGKLKQSGITGTVIGSGEVSYNSPYGRYQYYGKLMVGPAPRQLTNTDLQYHSGDSRRGAFWFERMKSDHLDDILKGAQRIANGG